VVKDTRDTAFVFASLALGMASGLGYWEVAVIGTVAVAALATIMHATNFGALYKSEFLLRFTFDQQQPSERYVQCLADHTKRSNLLHLEPSGDGKTLRLTFDVVLHKENTAQQLTAALGKVVGVSDVVLIVSKNDVDY
jgi:uncharacterized membrane protein YhiD involved in acid resistance